MSNRRFIYLLLLIVLMCVIAIKGSIIHNNKETYVDNAYTLEPQSLIIDKSTSNFDANNKDENCNIFTCKNPMTASDFEKWLKDKRNQIGRLLDIESDISQKVKDMSNIKCPPRISLDDWNEDIFDDDEKAALDNLEDLEGQTNELKDQLAEMEKQLADQRKDFAINAASQQQLLNDMENAKKQKKDENVHAKIVEMRWKPMETKVDRIDKEVKSNKKDISRIKKTQDAIKKIEDKLIKIVTEMNKKLDNLGAPKKKKKKSLF